MAKKNVAPVKLHEDVIESARIVAALEGVTMSDLLSDILRPTLAKMEQEGLTRRAAQTATQAEGPSKARSGVKKS